LQFRLINLKYFLKISLVSLSLTVIYLFHRFICHYLTHSMIYKSTITLMCFTLQFRLI